MRLTMSPMPEAAGRLCSWSLQPSAAEMLWGALSQAWHVERWRFLGLMDLSQV